MKLVKTISLVYPEGKSDQVYEADLCEVGPDRFVVNFRYGRRATRLRDGSKTPVPVDRTNAEQIFDALVRAKVDQGYRAPADAAVSSPAPVPAAASTAEAAARRERAILVRLRGDDHSGTAWKQSRVIWRAGELHLRAAEPLLWPFLASESGPRAAETPSLPGPPGPWRISAPWSDTAIASDDRVQESWGSWGAWPPQAWAGGAPEFLGYSAAWALGRCGSAASLPKLRAFIDDPATPDTARRIALESVHLLLTPEERAEAARQVLDGLPERLAAAVRRGTAEEVLDQLQAVLDEAAEQVIEALLVALPGLFDWRYIAAEEVNRYIRRLERDPKFRSRVRDRLDHGESSGHRVLADLYWIDDERTRPALLSLLRTAPLAPNFFRFVRYLFKVGELRDDFEMLGLLTYRFETTRPDAEPWYKLFPFAVPAEKGRPHPMVLRSYTGRTRAYLRRRAWRVLDRLGRRGSPDFVRLAEQVLLHFRDDDAGRVVTGRERRHGPRPSSTVTSDPFGSYYVLNQILHRKRRRDSPGRGGSFSSAGKGRSRPAIPAPQQREEAFPELWDQAPGVLLRLLERSCCGPVHEFAARALRDNQEYCRGLDLESLRMLAGQRYEPTARLGLDLAMRRFDPARPDPRLVLLLLDSPLPDALRQARAWIDEHWGILRGDAALVVGLVASPRARIRAFARDLLRRPPLSDVAEGLIVVRLVARLLSLGDADAEDARAGDIAATLLLVFRRTLRRVGEPVIRDLLAHPLAEVQCLGGDLVLGHDTFAQQPPPDVLRALLASPHDLVRGVGMKILDQLDDRLLKQNAEVLVWLTRHRLADLRANVRATVRRLAEQDRDFGVRVAEQLVASLLVPGAPEGVPGHTARVLREDLRPFLDRVPAETVLRLLQSRSSPAQEIGGLLLPTNVDVDRLGLEQLVRLASHDIFSVRAAVWHICGARPERLAADLRTAYRLADAKWEDSRRFAFTLFRDQLGGADWPPEALVGLCDSVKPDVQRFGQEMITRRFRDEHGERYALELSEHPDPAMHAFTGQFLDRFAADDPTHVRRLQFYCTVVLSRVNRGRVAKERVFAFLEKAARAGAETAAVTAEILARHSATAAISDRARARELMTFISSAYPAVEQPIRVRDAEVRDAV